jgi:hypothetical protein
MAWGTENIDINNPEMSTATRSFALEAAPAAPANVKAVPDQAKRTVTVTWAVNPEPDLIGYGVYRKGGDSPLGVIKAGDPTVFVHQLGSLPAGPYEYEVIAVRPKANASCCVFSGVSTAKATITSSPPTTTTKPGDSGGSTATTSTTTKGSTLANRGRNDLAAFGALLPNGGARLPNAPRRSEVDSGFEQDLPFAQKDAEQPVSGNDDDDFVQALGGRELASSDGDDRPTSLLFMAGGLLVTVVLMHLLWLRDEVNKGLLAAVDPDEPADL